MQAGYNPIRTLEIQMDVTSVINTLTEEERAICNAIMGNTPMADIAKAIGATRKQLITRIGHIKQVFEENGLSL